jgi:hypothetical protein
MNDSIVLSHIQTRTILHAWQSGMEWVQVSLDLGLTTNRVTLTAEGVHFPDGQRLTWEQVREINQTDVNCFVVEDDTCHKIQLFSDLFNRSYSLMPTEGAPTMLIAGFPMHRIKDTDPHQDTLKKLRAAGALRGRVLDTCTGLGYTAIEAARTAEYVTTIELDPTALEIARNNPWSYTLFASPNIEQKIGDACEHVTTFEDASFSHIIHDPPTFQLAGNLYSGAFYRELYRVLKPGGRLFHYIGNLESKSGHGVARGVVRRLGEAGFRRVMKKPEAFGVVAYK